ncbi:hypothetical protein Tco_0833387 [Tanacetum coccineum]
MEHTQRDEFLAEKDKSQPTWVIPTSYIPDAVNNWANALATIYQAPTENSLLEKTGDMRTFMNWYCQKREEDRAYSSRFGSKGSGQSLSISKMKATRYYDFGLELLIPEHMWIDDCFEFKPDYTIIDLPRAVVFPVSNNKQKIMRFNEIYMFSDGTLTNIMEALDYRVKEYKVNQLNPGDPDVHTLEDPTLILEILSRRFFLRLNLPYHRSVLIRSGGSSKDGDGDTSY